MDPSFNMPTHESQSPNIFPDDTSIDSGHSFALPTDSGPVDVTWLLHAISQPQRPGDACFWCHESGHQVLQCPKFSETLRHPHMVTFLKRLLDTRSNPTAGNSSRSNHAGRGSGSSRPRSILQIADARPQDCTPDATTSPATSPPDESAPSSATDPNFR